jgi:hypothetical protein
MIGERSVMETTSKLDRAVPMRSIKARLSDEDLRRVDDLAHQIGIDRAECVGQLIRKGLDAAPADESIHPGMTFAQILAPVHKEFAESGMTEEDLYQFLEHVREEVWQERQRAKDEE